MLISFSPQPYPSSPITAESVITLEITAPRLSLVAAAAAAASGAAAHDACSIAFDCFCGGHGKRLQLGGGAQSGWRRYYTKPLAIGSGGGGSGGGTGAAEGHGEGKVEGEGETEFKFVASAAVVIDGSLVEWLQSSELRIELRLTSASGEGSPENGEPTDATNAAGSDAVTVSDCTCPLQDLLVAAGGVRRRVHLPAGGGGGGEGVPLVVSAFFHHRQADRARGSPARPGPPTAAAGLRDGGSRGGGVADASVHSAGVQTSTNFGRAMPATTSTGVNVGASVESIPPAIADAAQPSYERPASPPPPPPSYPPSQLVRQGGGGGGGGGGRYIEDELDVLRRMMDGVTANSGTDVGSAYPPGWSDLGPGPTGAPPPAPAFSRMGTVSVAVDRALNLTAPSGCESAVAPPVWCVCGGCPGRGRAVRRVGSFSPRVAITPPPPPSPPLTSNRLPLLPPPHHPPTSLLSSPTHRYVTFCWADLHGQIMATPPVESARGCPEFRFSQALPYRPATSVTPPEGTQLMVKVWQRYVEGGGDPEGRRWGAGQGARGGARRGGGFRLGAKASG